MDRARQSFARICGGIVAAFFVVVSVVNAILVALAAGFLFLLVTIQSNFYMAFRLLGDLFENHKLARRLSLVWCIVLITWTMAMFWRHFDQITEHHADVILGVLLLLSTVIGLYHHHRGRGDK